jgi:hypothetical protein
MIARMSGCQSRIYKGRPEPHAVHRAIRILLQWRLANRTSWVDLRWLSNGLSEPTIIYVCIGKNILYNSAWLDCTDRKYFIHCRRHLATLALNNCLPSRPPSSSQAALYPSKSHRLQIVSFLAGVVSNRQARSE